MRRQLVNTLFLTATVVMVAAGCVPVSSVMRETATPAAGMANPASVYCEQQGYRLEIRTDASGGQAGVCKFPDGSECDEWAFYRGECKAGGQTAVAAETPAPLPTEPVAPTLAPAVTAVPAAVPGEGAVKYTSSALGISFSYLPEQNGQTIGVIEQDDTIYVHPATIAPTAGQYVRVFEKKADESLVDAITRIIMPGYAAEDCQVVEIADPIGSGGHPANFRYAGIMVRRGEGEDETAVLERWKTCPQPYTVVGGIGYFQADTEHPDKFLFFSIGQYGVMAGERLPWQETVKFE